MVKIFCMLSVNGGSSRTKLFLVLAEKQLLSTVGTLGN
jgi:hypothetical protein